MRIKQKLGKHPPDILVKNYTAYLLGASFPDFPRRLSLLSDNYFQKYVPTMFCIKQCILQKYRSSLINAYYSVYCIL